MNFKKLLESEGEKLKSKKNDVTAISNDKIKVIRKRYKNKQAMETELATIKLLKNKSVAVPNVLFTQENTIVFEQIEGILYEKIIDRIEQGLLEERSIKRVAKELCLWLDDYYVATQNAYRGDVNLRNFIFTSHGNCVSIDFEEMLQYGNHERDMGKILVYIATYDPPFTIGKLQLCKAFLENFLIMNAKIEKIHKEYNAELDAMKKRRAGFAKIELQAKEFWELIVNNYFNFK